jgi:hypothetical protein
LGPLGTAATNRPIVPALGDYDGGEIGGMIGRGNRSTRKKPAPVPLCPPQIPHAARTRTRAAAVGSQRLTASATARPRKRTLSVLLGFAVLTAVVMGYNTVQSVQNQLTYRRKMSPPYSASKNKPSKKPECAFHMLSRWLLVWLIIRS